MQVSESETGLVRLFAVDVTPLGARALREDPAALPPLLGVEALDPAHWEVFDLADLSGIGLEAYLAEGHGIPDEDLLPMRGQLAALSGPVFLLRSAAITSRPVTLSPRAPLRWVATFGEDRPPVPLRTDLTSQGAQGRLSPAPSGDRGPRGSLVVLVLGVVLTAAIALAIFLLTRGTGTG